MAEETKETEEDRKKKADEELEKKKLEEKANKILDKIANGDDILSTDSNSEILSAIRENLFKASFDNPGDEIIDKSIGNVVVDIMTNYAWINETAFSESEIQTNIPYCLLIEREQTVSSSIMNIVRDVRIIGQGIKKIQSSLGSIGDNDTDYLDKVEYAGQDRNSFLGGVIDSPIIDSLLANFDTNVLSKSKVSGAKSDTGSILSPYNFLYATETTGFRYIFPMLSGQDLYALSNVWSNGNDSNNSYLLHNPLTNMMHSWAASMANTVGADLPNIVNALDNQAVGSNKSSAFEMAKYFSFDTENTEEVRVDFVLFNTVAKDGIIDQWKRNLYFITLFNIRNLPFKIDYTTYLPPLLYDVIIPGIKRLPFAYVSSFSAEPQGLIRTLKINNFLAKACGIDTSDNNYITVPVPEAWTVSITFKSLLARTANTVLAGSVDLPISISLSSGGINFQSDNIDAVIS